MNVHMEKASGKSLWNFAFWFLILLYMETLLQVFLFAELSSTYWYIAGFTASIATLVSGLLGLLPKKANRIVSVVLISVVSILFCSQLVYNAVFGTMYSLSMVGMGGDALANFWRETLMTIWEIFPSLLAMLAPIPVAAVLAVKRPGMFDLGVHWHRIVVISLALLIHLAVYNCLSIGGTGYFTTYYMYHSPDTTTDHAAQRFGFLTTIRLELTVQESAEENGGFDVVVETTVPETQSTSPAEESDATEATEPPVEYNMLEIDFDYLNSLTDNEKLIELNNYVASLSPTNKNEYTGMLADYNLITICAESFSTAAIDPELTPTLYKLSTEGFIFNNYYNSYPNVTTDGEYSFCLGLWPDTTRDKEYSSFQVSGDNALPYALGNAFRSQLGITSYGYHNFDKTYYGRNITHPNMGYECKFANSGMTFTTSWPSSDLEMMEQTVADYLSSGEQFHAYYMTFSGHYIYNKQNPMASRNYDVVVGLDYSETVKCYLSCNIELEKALAYLMEQLEAAGVADKTAIVIGGDHFPYGLYDSQYSELIGYEIDEFSKYKSTLIFWVGGMEEPVYVDEYMCNNDILPTILNLWGFEFDSRLLAGTDVFSDGEHIAILRDQSFYTEDVWFSTASGETVWLTENVDESLIDSTIRKIKNQFSLSEKILNNDYYRYLSEYCEALQYE